LGFYSLGETFGANHPGGKTIFVGGFQVGGGGLGHLPMFKGVGEGFVTYCGESKWGKTEKLKKKCFFLRGVWRGGTGKN